MAGSGPHWSNPYFDGMGNVHGLIFRRCCYSSQIIKIFVWLAVYFGLCSCRSNAFEETQNASTGMLDSITPIFLGYWHVLIFWRDAWLLANDRNLILICRVLLIIQLHIKCIWKDTKCIDKNAWLHYSHIFRVLAYARSESQTGCIFSQLQTSVARQSAFLVTLMTKTQFSRQSIIRFSLPPS